MILLLEFVNICLIIIFNIIKILRCNVFLVNKKYDISSYVWISIFTSSSPSFWRINILASLGIGDRHVVTHD